MTVGIMWYSIFAFLRTFRLNESKIRLTAIRRHSILQSYRMPIEKCDDGNFLIIARDADLDPVQPAQRLKRFKNASQVSNTRFPTSIWPLRSVLAVSCGEYVA